MKKETALPRGFLIGYAVVAIFGALVLALIGELECAMLSLILMKLMLMEK